MHLDTLWYAVALVWLGMLIGTVIFVFTRGTMDKVSPLGRLDLRTATQGRPLDCSTSSSDPMVEGPWCRFRREARARERHRHCSGG